MDVPTVVADALGDEAVAARVPLKGEDILFVTPTRTLVYRSEGFISDESVEEYSHEAERVSVQEGRRKGTITLDYGTRGQDSFGVPSSQIEDVLHPVLAGVLNAAGVTDAGETVKRTFRFSELTLVVTSDRVVKHIGAAVWDHEYEEVPYEAVTDIETEEGNVSSQLVLTTEERTERVKAPSEGFRQVAESVREALFAYHEVADIEAFRQLMAAEEETEVAEPDTGDVSFEETVDPIGAGGNEATGTPEETGAEKAAEELEERGFQAATEQVETTLDGKALATALDEIDAALDEQAEQIKRQRERIDAIRDLIPDQ